MSVVVLKTIFFPLKKFENTMVSLLVPLTLHIYPSQHLLVQCH